MRVRCRLGMLAVLPGVLFHTSVLQGQPAPPAYFEVVVRYESIYVNQNNGFLGVQYCAGTAYGRFGDAKCELQGSPPQFLPVIQKSSADGGVSFDTTGYGPGSLVANLGFGANTVSGSLKGAYNWVDDHFTADNWALDLSATLNIFVRGGPGTKFHLDYSLAEAAQASVSQLNCGSGHIDAGFSSPQSLSVGANQVGDSNAQSVTVSPLGGIDGFTSTTARTYMGATYTLANTLPMSLILNTNVYRACSPTDFTGQSQTTGNLSLSVKITQTSHPDPTPHITAPTTAAVGQQIMLDGSTSQAFGTGVPIVAYKWTIQRPGAGSWSTPGTQIVPRQLD